MSGWSDYRFPECSMAFPLTIARGLCNALNERIDMFNAWGAVLLPLSHISPPSFFSLGSDSFCNYFDAVLNQILSCFCNASKKTYTITVLMEELQERYIESFRESMPAEWAMQRYRILNKMTRIYSQPRYINWDPQNRILSKSKEIRYSIADSGQATYWWSEDLTFGNPSCYINSISYGYVNGVRTPYFRGLYLISVSPAETFPVENNVFYSIDVETIPYWSVYSDLGTGLTRGKYCFPLKNGVFWSGVCPENPANIMPKPDYHQPLGFQFSNVWYYADYTAKLEYK